MKRSFEVVIRDGKAYVTGTVDGKPLVEDLEARMALEDQARLIDTLHGILARLRVALGVHENDPAIDRARELVEAEKVLKAKGLAREEFEAKQRRISDLVGRVMSLEEAAAFERKVSCGTRERAEKAERQLSAAQVENTRLKNELDAAADYHDACGRAIEDALAGDKVDGLLGARFDVLSASIMKLKNDRDEAKVTTGMLRADLIKSRDELKTQRERNDKLRAELVERRRYWEQQHANRTAERDEAYERAGKARRELIAARAEKQEIAQVDGVVFANKRFDLKTLQVRLPWTIKYSGDFRANPQPHKDFAHALLHVVKATGQLAAFIDDMDHDRNAALFAGARLVYTKNLADLVVCALRLANTFPGGPVDLERAVVERIETKNGVKL